MAMPKFECDGCGGKLRENGRVWVCENCGTQYLIGNNDDGQPFLYQPIEKKPIETGQIAEKASQIKTETISVKEIKLPDSIDADVHRESVNIEIRHNLTNISRYINGKEWEAAQKQINQVLLSDLHNAEAHWYGWMCDKRISTERDLIKSFSSFTQADGEKLDGILSNSTPEFAKRVIDLLWDGAYLNDQMCFLIMSVILPYAKNESLYSKEEFESKATDALDRVISRTYPQSFAYLLKTCLHPEDVDLYISYLEEFGDNCAAPQAQTYYEEILKVDPGNLPIHHKLVLSDIDADSPPDKCESDFDRLLKYSDEPDAAVLSVFNAVNQKQTTSDPVSQFVWDLLGRYSGGPEALKTHILAYSRILLQSALWTQAKKFLHLVLSFDARNAEAYWLLCLQKLQAKTESEIAGKKNNLIDLPEFNKSMALYESAGEKKKADELFAYTAKQRMRKKTVKIAIIAGAAVLALIVLQYVFNLLKYNTNVYVALGDEAYDDGWSYRELPMTFKNKGWVDISYLSGVMTFYDEDGNTITAVKLDVSGLPHGEEQTLALTLNASSAQMLYDTHYEAVKITFAVTYIRYIDNTEKNPGDGKEKTIKKITASAKEIDEANKSSLRATYDAAMKAYDDVDVKSPNGQTELVNAISMLDDVWEDILKSEELMQDMYDKACAYQNKEEYEKAEVLFSLLAYYDFNGGASRSMAYDYSEALCY